MLNLIRYFLYLNPCWDSFLLPQIYSKSPKSPPDGSHNGTPPDLNVCPTLYLNHILVLQHLFVRVQKQILCKIVLSNVPALQSEFYKFTVFVNLTHISKFLFTRVIFRWTFSNNRQNSINTNLSRTLLARVMNLRSTKNVLKKSSLSSYCHVM